MVERWLTRLALWLVSRYHIVVPRQKQLADENAILLLDLREANQAADAIGVEAQRLLKELANAQQELEDIASVAKSNQDTISGLIEMKRTAEAISAERLLKLNGAQMGLQIALDEASTARIESALRQAAIEDYKEQLSKSIPIPDAVQAMLERAKQGVSRIDNDSRNGTSGEWKRHRLLDEMLQAFPTAAVKDICLAIELAVRS